METTVTLALATWYLAYALTKTHGAFGMFEKLRKLDERIDLNLLVCIVCTAFWVALGMLVLWTVAPLAVQVFAVAGLAMLAHKYTGWDYA